MTVNSFRDREENLPTRRNLYYGASMTVGLGRMRSTLCAFGATLLLAGVLAGVALAGSPSNQVYSSSGSKVDSALASGGSTPAKSSPFTPPTSSSGSHPEAASSTSPAVASSTLPFTGLDLGVVLAAGVLLIGVGFGLRRVTRKPPQA
jgi:hypothetical protein